MKLILKSSWTNAEDFQEGKTLRELAIDVVRGQLGNKLIIKALRDNINEIGYKTVLKIFDDLVCASSYEIIEKPIDKCICCGKESSLEICHECDKPFTSMSAYVNKYVIGCSKTLYELIKNINLLEDVDFIAKSKATSSMIKVDSPLGNLYLSKDGETIYVVE